MDRLAAKAVCWAGTWQEYPAGRLAVLGVACMLAAGRACWAQAACMHSQRAEQQLQPRMERSSVQSLGRQMSTLHLKLAKRARMRGCSPKAAGAAMLGRAPG